MRFNVKYIGAGGTVDMSSAPILYQEHDFMKRTHGYEVTQLLSGIGGRLTRFQKDSREYKIILSVWRDDMYDTLNWMTDIFDRDVAEKVPGKLFVNDEYLQCYVVGSDVKNWTLSGNGVAVELTIFAEKPIWVKEELQTFDTFEANSAAGFKLPTAIPFGFTSSAGSRQLNIDHYTSVLAEISLFGPATSPSFSIGSHIYQVFGALSAGERYVINQINKTVKKITNSGEVINSFNLRNKEYSVFDPIPAGESIMNYSGEFPISITLFYERGEPKWK